jgi:hypothetical protein
LEQLAGTEELAAGGPQVVGPQVIGPQVVGTQVAGTQVVGTYAGTQVAGTQVAGTQTAGTEEVAAEEAAGTQDSAGRCKDTQMRYVLRQRSQCKSKRRTGCCTYGKAVAEPLVGRCFRNTGCNTVRVERDMTF